MRQFKYDFELIKTRILVRRIRRIIPEFPEWKKRRKKKEEKGIERDYEEKKRKNNHVIWHINICTHKQAHTNTHTHAHTYTKINLKINLTPIKVRPN